MLYANLALITPEQRLENLEKSRLSRLTKKAYAEENLKLDWQDLSFWKEAAASLDIRLPQRYDTGPKGVKKVARNLGIDIKEFVQSTGFTTLNDFCTANKTYPSFAVVGILLEWHLGNIYEKELANTDG